MKSPVSSALPLAAMIALGAWGAAGARPAPPPPPPPANGPSADYPMTIGAPFTIGDKTYTPVDRMNVDDVGYAAVDPAIGGGVAAAHKTLPLPSYAEVTSLVSGKTILVRVTQRGPMNNDTLVALSAAAAAQLGLDGAGPAPVRMRRVNPPETERAALRSGDRAPERMATPKTLVDVLRRKLGLPALTPPPDIHAVAGPPPPNGAPAAPVKPAKSAASRPNPPASGIIKLDPDLIDPAPAPVPVPAPVPAPSSSPAPAPTAPDAPEPPAAKPATPPKKPERPPAPPAAATGSFVVQVATFSSEQRADAAAKKLGAGVAQSGRFWRMRMGPFATRRDAEAALAKARRAGYSDARIQRAD